jgi:hypothetical protein
MLRPMDHRNLDVKVLVIQQFFTFFKVLRFSIQALLIEMVYAREQNEVPSAVDCPRNSALFAFSNIVEICTELIFTALHFLHHLQMGPLR